MQRKLIRAYVVLAGILLLVTGISKLISSYGGAQILQRPDPILIVSYRHLFLIIGTMEITFAIVCWFNKNIALKIYLIAWLATSLLTYRLGLIWIGYHKPCSCLGNVTDALHIGPQVADNIMKCVLAYLFIGSYGILFQQWWKKKAEGKMNSEQAKT